MVLLSVYVAVYAFVPLLMLHKTNTKHTLPQQLQHKMIFSFYIYYLELNVKIINVHRIYILSIDNANASTFTATGSLMYTSALKIVDI